MVEGFSWGGERAGELPTLSRGCKDKEVLILSTILSVRNLKPGGMIIDCLHLGMADAFSPVLSAWYWQTPEARAGSDLGAIVGGVGEKPGMSKDRLQAQPLAHLNADALAQQILPHQVEKQQRKYSKKIFQPTLHGSDMRWRNLSSAPQICSSDSKGMSPHT